MLLYLALLRMNTIPDTIGYDINESMILEMNFGKPSYYDFWRKTETCLFSSFMYKTAVPLQLIWFSPNSFNCENFCKKMDSLCM